MVWVIGLNYCPGEPCNYSKSPSDNEQENEFWIPFAQGPSSASGNDAADAKDHPKYYEHQDLRAQESVARATNAIVMLTLIGVAVGGIGTGLIYVTFRETRKAATQSAKATEAANEANLIAREIGEKEIKAYCGLSKVDIQRTPIGIGVGAWLENFGVTPAYNATCTIDGSVSLDGGEPWTFSTANTSPPSATVTPRVSTALPGIMFETTHIASRAAWVVLKMTIIYGDVFNKVPYRTVVETWYASLGEGVGAVTCKKMAQKHDQSD